MSGAWERGVRAGDRDPREAERSQRHPATETQTQRETEKLERPGVKNAETTKDPEVSAKVAQRPGKNVKYTEAETPRGTQHRKTARHRRPRPLDLEKERALQREQEVGQRERARRRDGKKSKGIR